MFLGDGVTDVLDHCDVGIRVSWFRTDPFKKLFDTDFCHAGRYGTQSSTRRRPEN